MHQIKLFKGVESDVPDLENRVNAWIKDTAAKVLQITGNIAPQSSTTDEDGGKLGGSYTPSDVLLIVVYEAA